MLLVTKMLRAIFMMRKSLQIVLVTLVLGAMEGIVLVCMMFS
jgi:hypothetical protein